MYRFYSKCTADNPIRVCVAAIHQDGNLKIAVSRCGKKDRYIKQIGRIIAENRLNANKLYNEFPMGSCDSKKFVEIAKKVAEEVTETKIIYNIRQNVLKILKNNGVTEEDIDEIELSDFEKAISD